MTSNASDKPSRSASADLLRDVTNGDVAALDVLVERHAPALMTYVRLRASPTVRDKEATVDIVQSVCREVLADFAGETAVSESQFRRWLFTAAASKIRDKARYYLADRRDPVREADVVAFASRGFAALTSPAAGPTPSRAAMAKEDFQSFERAFDELPDEHRRVILLARIVGLTHREIAVELDKTEVATRQLLSRATARLLRLMMREE